MCYYLSSSRGGICALWLLGQSEKSRYQRAQYQKNPSEDNANNPIEIALHRRTQFPLNLG